ncbi:MAG: hypothetical protein EBZ74_08575 [Planctomycetia bacterium]|nr:hypothetical protein [Planctomycetia bacterium]
MTEEKTRIVPRAGPRVAGGTITFHCDNGHRINVPVKLAGKRGACSKCGIAVVIPLAGATPDRAEPAVPAAVEIAAEAAAATPPAEAFADLFAGVAAATPVAEEPAIDVTAPAAEPATGGGSEVGDVVAGYGPEAFATPDETAAENPTAQLVARLWLERAHGGVVELHLAGGGVILPEWYEARWSRGTHGLFASQAADGTVTLTAVAWDSIQKVIVRQVEGLPDGMFE